MRYNGTSRMERDFDLVRLILKDIQAMPAGESYTRIDHLSGYDSATVFAHVDLLLNAGLIKGRVLKLMHGIGGINVSGLTWEGYDFLDAAKDETLWTKAKERLIKPGVSITFDILLNWLKHEATTKIGLP